MEREDNTSCLLILCVLVLLVAIAPRCDMQSEINNLRDRINAIEDRMEGAISLSGAGLKDTTRIAMSPAQLWRDICMLNRDNIIQGLDAYMAEIKTIRDFLANGDSAALEARLKRAERKRRAVEG